MDTFILLILASERSNAPFWVTEALITSKNLSTYCYVKETICDNSAHMLSPFLVEQKKEKKLKLWYCFMSNKEPLNLILKE